MGKRGARAQATIETGITLPVLIILISAFIGLLIANHARVVLDTATQTAAAAGASATAGRPDELTDFATRSYCGTFTYSTQNYPFIYPTDGSGRPVSCANSIIITCGGGSCSSGYTAGQTVTVTAHATLDMSRVPGANIFFPWKVALSSNSSVVTSPHRST